MTIIERALELLANDSRIGLGSGHAAQAFVRALGERVRRGRLAEGIRGFYADARKLEQYAQARVTEKVAV
jgi:ribose 5-phosphate isomerase